MVEIFKIQLPLETNDPEPKAYIYNEGKRVELLIPVHLIIGEFNANETKIYVLGKVTAEGFGIIKKVQWQDW